MLTTVFLSRNFPSYRAGGVVSQACVLTLFALEYFLKAFSLSWLWYLVVDCSIVFAVALLIDGISNLKSGRQASA